MVVPADPFDDGELELAAGLPDAVADQLGLEGVDEALGHRVVRRVAGRSQGTEDVVVDERLGEVKARMLGGFTRSSQHLDRGGL